MQPQIYKLNLALGKIAVRAPLFKGKATLIKKPTLTETEKLIHAVEQSQSVIYSASTVFPLVLFTDTISIDRSKVTLIHRNGLRNSNTASVGVNDIQNVASETGPFFGSISLTSSYFTNNVQTITHLKRKDVEIIHKLLQGSIMAHRMKIDTAGIDREQLLILLSELGESSMK